MPGRTPNEALAAFLDPIERALACVARAKITPSEHPSTPNVDHVWSINGADGARLGNGDVLEAIMRYQIIPTESPDLPWRATTLAYFYTLRSGTDERFLMHWHPAGRSPYPWPHVHLPSSGVDETHHLPTGRLAFEDMIEWAINFGAPPLDVHWQEILASGRALHQRHATWIARPER